MSETSSTARKATNLSVNQSLLADARSLGINISRSAEQGIELAVRAAKREKWLKENSDALASSNTYVDANGLPLSDYTQF